ncbi:MAG: hypothetical protein HY682_00515 [Chloroflexi bacterium]|nr:hypothetical protein [Chloroflexota bacterium]
MPDAVQRRTEARLNRFAEQHSAGRYTRLEVRFRGLFCYVDAYTEPEPCGADWLPPGGRETREEYLERLRNTPGHLCRLRYSGQEDRWGFAFYTYGHERYERSFLPSGRFYGTPEEAFEASASVYLQ